MKNLKRDSRFGFRSNKLSGRIDASDGYPSDYSCSFARRIGDVGLMSASSERSVDASYLTQRQLIWLLLSVVAAILTARLDYRFYEKRLFLALLAITP